MGNLQEQITKKKTDTGINNTAGINTTTGINTVHIQENEEEQDQGFQQHNMLQQRDRMMQDARRYEEMQQQQQQVSAPMQKTRIVIRLEGDLPAGEENTGKNRFQQLRQAMNDVRQDKKTVSGDSWWMKLVKTNIDLLNSLIDSDISRNTNLEALRAKCSDRLLELVHSCRAYLKARSSDRDENPRHAKVRTLFEAARKVLGQITSIRGTDYMVLFTEEHPHMTLGEALEKDAEQRSLNREGTKSKMREGLDSVYARRHFGLFGMAEIFRDTPDLYSLLHRYLQLQRESIPSDPAAFRKKREQMRRILEDAGGMLVGIDMASAWLEKNKVRKYHAAQLRHQLRWEYDILNKTAFQDVQPGNSWNTVFEGVECVVDSTELSEDEMDRFTLDGDLILKDKFFTQKEVEQDGKKVKTKVLKDEFKGLDTNQIGDGYKGTALMAELLGVTDLFEDVREVTLLNTAITGQKKDRGAGRQIFAGNLQKGFIQQKSGYTLSEALEIARKTKKNMTYSDEAVKQIITIQLMDTICGQVNRDANGLHVELGVSSIEGEEYLVINRVMAANNEFSFGTAGFKDVNRNSKRSTLKAIWNDRNQRSNLLIYDTDFADRVLALDLNDLKQAYAKKGFDEARIEALLDRVQGVRDMLLKDKQNPKSLRAQRDANRTRDHYDTKTDKERKEYDKRFDGLYTNLLDKGFVLNTYLHEDLIRKKGITEEQSGQIFDDRYWNVSDANRYEDDKLHSVKERKAFFKKYDSLIAEDVQGIQKRQYSPQFFEIMALMQVYVDLDITAEKAGTLYYQRKDMQSYLKTIRGYVPEEPLKSALSKMTLDEGLQTVESDVIRRLKEKIEGRITALSGNKSKDANETYELKRLKKYITILDGTGGGLEVPHVDISDSQFMLLDEDDKPLTEDKLRNDRDKVLFPHPPCIQDVRQGGLETATSWQVLRDLSSRIRILSGTV